MICQLKTSWAAGLEHPHMSSPHGPAFPTIWWLDSKSEPPERKQGRSCLQIFMTEPLSYILSLMQDPIRWYCLKPLPRGKRKEKTWTTSHCAVDHTQEHEERNKHTGVAFFGKYSLPHTACPNWMCGHTHTCSTSFVFYITEQNQYRFSHPRENVGVIFDSSLFPLLVNLGLGQFWRHDSPQIQSLSVLSANT